MNKIIITFSLFFLAACSNNDGASNAIEPEEIANDKTIVISGNGRTYRIALPENGFDENKAYKLLLAFHGSGQTAEGMQRMAAFETLSDDYIVVYPQSQEVEWDDGCQCNIAHRLKANDVEFIKNIIADMHTNYPLISEENYAVGFSQGGLFSQNMLCKHSALFKGVASVASPMSVQLASSCSIEQPTHYLLVQGKNDTVLNYNGYQHSNFGLISAPAAAQLIAKQNEINASPIKKDLDNGIGITSYLGENNIITKLVSIEGGGHTWVFNHYDTSQKVIEFFDSHSHYNFSTGSALYRTERGDYHIRTLGEKNNNAEVVVLSGANKFFHSDSAWVSLLQPLIAEHTRVHVIDRLNNAWSRDTEEPSFSVFAQDLPELLEKLQLENVVFVAFANSNLATLMYQNMPNHTIHTKGMVWIDPDILLPHSIAQYQSGSIESLRAYKQEYIEHVAAGNWTEKTKQRLALEREEIQALLPEKYLEQMDWAYFDAVSAKRLSPSRQVSRIKEMINYHDDLNKAYNLISSNIVPISIIDSDFERLDIASADEQYKAGLIKWHEEGTVWSKELTKNTQGQYYPLTNASHQVMFEHPDTVIKAVLDILNQ